jgi:hypothetical protein
MNSPRRLLRSKIFIDLPSGSHSQTTSAQWPHRTLGDVA